MYEVIFVMGWEDSFNTLLTRVVLWPQVLVSIVFSILLEENTLNFVFHWKSHKQDTVE